MSQQEKAKEAASLLIAWADGKTLQQLGRPNEWSDYTGEQYPAIFEPAGWRIKPEPRKAWSVGSCITEDHGVVDQWRKVGCDVTEWQEVRK